MNNLEFLNEWMVYFFAISNLMLIKDQSELLEAEDRDDGMLEVTQQDNLLFIMKYSLFTFSGINCAIMFLCQSKTNMIKLHVYLAYKYECYLRKYKVWKNIDLKCLFLDSRPRTIFAYS